MITVISNPASGGSLDDNELRALLEGAREADVLEWHETSSDDPGTNVARQAMAARSTGLVVCGGDGTVRAVVEAISGSTVPLGVIPLGTGNLLASNHGLTADEDGAAIALRGAVTPLDVLEVNGESSVVMAGIGFDADMIDGTNTQLKRRVGSLAYVTAAFRSFPARLFDVTVEVDGRRWFTGRAAMVLVGNCGTVSGGLEVFPDARPDDGRLDVAVLSVRSVWDWTRVFWCLVRHRPQPKHLVHRVVGRRVLARTTRPIAYELDGEVREPTTELSVHVRPGALWLRVPA